METAPIVPADIAGAALADAEAPAAPGAAGEGGRPWSPGAPSVLPVPVAVDYDAEARDIVETVFTLIAPLYPSLAPIYTPDVRARIAKAGAPLMQKYGLTLGAFGPEIVFTMTVVPLVVPTVQAIRHDREQAQKQNEGGGAAAGEQAAPRAGADDLRDFPNYNPGESGAT